MEELKIEKHIKYFIRCLNALPGAYGSLDTSRMTVLFFSLSGLDLLDALSRIEKDRSKIIDWIYSLQILPTAGSNEDTSFRKCGFRGAPFLGHTFNPNGSHSSCELYEGAHVTMTYTALLSLIILNDDISRVDQQAVVFGLKELQLENGSFHSTPEGSENDMRFLYCACCISYILQDWRGVDKERAIDYIKQSMGYDFGISQGPQLESHGGSTFCAIASLVLMDALNDCFTPKEIEKLRRWCVVRQKTGFQGRPNKPVDTCYSFWVGASLMLLDSYDLIDKRSNMEFLLSTQHPITGGFSKWPDVHADVLHTYFGLCGMSLMKECDLQPLSPALNCSQRALERLQQIHQQAKT